MALKIGSYEKLTSDIKALQTKLADYNGGVTALVTTVKSTTESAWQGVDTNAYVAEITERADTDLKKPAEIVQAFVQFLEETERVLAATQQDIAAQARGVTK